MSALVFADELALLAATARGMRLMLGICDDFVQESPIAFSAKKSNNLRVQQSSAGKVSSF